MAIIKCPECGHDVSDKAAACPNCGYPVSKILKSKAENTSSLDDESTQENNQQGDTFSADQASSSTVSPLPAKDYSSKQPGNTVSAKTELKPTPAKKQKKRLPTWLVVIITIVAVLASLFILLIIAYLIAHRGQNTQQSTTTAAQSSPSGITTQPYFNSETNSGAATSETSENAHEVVHDPDAIKLTLADTTFWIPGYYTAGEANNGNGAANATFSILYTYEETSTSGSGIQVFTYDASGITESTYKSTMRGMGESFLEDMLGDDASDDITLQDSGNTEYAGMPGYYMSYSGDPSGLHFDMEVNSYLDEDNDQITAFFLFALGDIKKDVIADYNNMLSTAVRDTADSIEANKEESAFSDSKSSNKSASKSSSGVSPELKETLDSYESIMNKYCDFMEKYNSASSSDALAMLNDYYKMLDEYSEAMDKINNLDTSNMSTADYEYYLDVTNRVSKRLLEVAQ